MADEKGIVPFDRKFVRIAKNLGRALKWVTDVMSKDHSQLALHLLRVEPREGKYGHGVVMASDGLRVHMAQEINTGKEDPDRPWLFEERLDLPEGKYEVRTMVQARDHINEFLEITGHTFPNVEKNLPSMNNMLKPVAIIPVNPELLIDAMRNAEKGQPIYIRVFRSKKQLDEDDIVVNSGFEVISTDRFIEEIKRLAIVMPMHMRDETVEEWPTAWDGWPEDKEEEDSDS